MRSGDDSDGHAHEKPECPACAKTASRYLPNVAERYTQGLLVPAAVLDAYKCIPPEPGIFRVPRESRRCG